MEACQVRIYQRHNYKILWNLKRLFVKTWMSSSKGSIWSSIRDPPTWTSKSSTQSSPTTFGAVQKGSNSERKSTRGYSRPSIRIWRKMSTIWAIKTMESMRAFTIPRSLTSWRVANTNNSQKESIKNSREANRSDSIPRKKFSKLRLTIRFTLTKTSFSISLRQLFTITASRASQVFWPHSPV